MDAMSGGMPVPPEPAPLPQSPTAMPAVPSPPFARFLVWLGAIVAIVGALVAGASFAILWATTSGGALGTGQAAVYETLDFAYIGSRGVVGAGIFLASLGLAVRGPRRNPWILLGGALVLVGTAGSASVEMYTQSLFFGGHFPGVQAISSLSAISTAVSVLEPVGLGLLLLGFVFPRGASWMD